MTSDAVEAPAPPETPVEDTADAPAHGPAYGRFVYRCKQPLFALPFYSWTLAGAGATQLVFTPTDPWPGDAQAGGETVHGRFDFAGQCLNNPRPFWAPSEASAEWRRALNGFAWLRDLRAAGGDGARRRARELVAQWIEDNANRWDSLIWSPEVTGRRLTHWLGHYEFYAASAQVDFRHRLLYETSRQARHLARALPAGLTSASAVTALKGLIVTGACLPNGEGWLRRGLQLLCQELPRQLLADGGHIERSPRRMLELLRDLIDIRAAVHGAGQALPDQVQAAIEGLAPMVRLLQHGDGGLALFNDSNEDEGWQVDMVLQRAGGRSRPWMSAPESGFERLHAGRTVVLVDAGAPPPPGADRLAHAGTLSFEMSVGRERLIVNCGSHSGDPDWRRAQRLTAAHSTLVLDDTNSAELARDGALRRRPEAVICRREEQEGSQWLDMAHDGYRRRRHQIHHRRLYLAPNGDDLRGEDCLEGDGGEAFKIRFHLHPDVAAGLTQSGDGVILRLAKGGGWRLRAEGAAPYLEDSIYMGTAGTLRRSQQVVLEGPVSQPATVVKWALRREARSGA